MTGSGAVSVVRSEVRDNGFGAILAGSHQEILIENTTIASNGFGIFSVNQNAVINHSTIAESTLTGINEVIETLLTNSIVVGNGTDIQGIFDNSSSRNVVGAVRC